MERRIVVVLGATGRRDYPLLQLAGVIKWRGVGQKDQECGDSKDLVKKHHDEGNLLDSRGLYKLNCV